MATAALVLLALMAAASWAAAALDVSPVPFHAGFTQLFGGDNLVLSPDGRSVRLKLDRRTGSGFVSKLAYSHGFFSASIQLPDDYTAGVVVAFYEMLQPLQKTTTSHAAAPPRPTTTHAAVHRARGRPRCHPRPVLPRRACRCPPHHPRPCARGLPHRRLLGTGRRALPRRADHAPAAYLAPAYSVPAVTVDPGKLSNGDVFPDNHDEVDFELLGNRPGHGWHVQTNIYGNGSTSRGREERYLLPFDPTARPHTYAVSWTATAVVFYVDGTPVREAVRVPGIGGDFPGKPMSVYATIWDGSAWATDGGRYHVDYAYAPFAADFSELVLRGCPASPYGGGGVDKECEVDVMTDERAVVTPAKRAAMRRFRQRNLIYTVCHDRVRYGGKVFPECDVDESHDRFHEWGEAKSVVPLPRRLRADKQAVAVADGRPTTWPVGVLRAD